MVGATKILRKIIRDISENTLVECRLSNCIHTVRSFSAAEKKTQKFNNGTRTPRAKQVRANNKLKTLAQERGERTIE